MSHDKRLDSIFVWVSGIAATLLCSGICATAAIAWDTREKVVRLETKLDIHLQEPSKEKLSYARP